MKNLINKIQDLENQIIKEEKQKIYIKQERYFLVEMKKIGIEKLPYSYSALKRFVDPETMDTHYNKHYKGYVDKLNSALSQGKFGDLELEQIVKSIKKYNKKIKNNAGGAFNHALFWKMLSPKQIKPEKFEIYKKICSEFKTFRTFVKNFESAAKDRFGSGWVWLVLTKAGKLKIMSTANQENPLMNTIKDGGYPLLGLDLWEHSYYLKYKSNKDEYIKNFWKVVNWEFVNKLYQMKKETKINEGVIMGKLFLGENESQTKFITKKVMDLYPKLKSKYASNIRSILKDVYPENYVKGDSWYNTGIYNLEKQGRSVINKFDTNYSVMGILLDSVNEFIRKKGKETEIDLSGNNEKEVNEQLDKLLGYLWKYKVRIFSKDSKLFHKLLDMVTTTHDIGDVNEMHAVILLKKLFKNVTKIGELGAEKDMGGVDVEIEHEGKIFTAQVKPINTIREVDDNYEITINSGVKEYKTNWMIFIENRRKIYVFPTSKVKIEGDKYVVPTKYKLFILE
jgi:Fe-Mn family superoxide dismutase